MNTKRENPKEDGNSKRERERIEWGEMIPGGGGVVFWSDLRFLFPIKYVRMYMQLQMGYIIIGFATFSQLSTARKPPNSRVLVSVASRGWSRGQQMYGVQRWREEREWVPAVLCVCVRGEWERENVRKKRRRPTFQLPSASPPVTRGHVFIGIPRFLRAWKMLTSTSRRRIICKNASIFVKNVRDIYWHPNFSVIVYVLLSYAG